MQISTQKLKGPLLRDKIVWSRIYRDFSVGKYRYILLLLQGQIDKQTTVSRLKTLKQWRAVFAKDLCHHDMLYMLKGGCCHKPSVHLFQKAQNRSISYHAHLELLDKGRAIKRLVVYSIYSGAIHILPYLIRKSRICL